MGVPEDVEGLVGVDDVELFGQVEIVEVVCLEEWLDLAVFVLLGLAVLVTVGFDDGAVALALTEQDEVLLADSIEGFAISMRYYQFGLVLFGIYLNESCLCV